MRENRRWFAALVLLVGCARGTAGVDELDASTLGDPQSLGGEDDGGATGGGASAGNASNGAGEAGGSSGSSSPDEGGEPDSGTAADQGDVAANTCPAAISCEEAEAVGIPTVGSIEWSKTDLITTKNEAGSHWYLVDVTGDSASQVVNGGIEARLQSPAGTNYDVFLYGGADGFNSGLDTCEAPPDAGEAAAAQSTKPAGELDSANLAWSAGTFGILSDRKVTVEVRHIDGPCAAFTLELYGAVVER